MKGDGNRDVVMISCLEPCQMSGRFPARTANCSVSFAESDTASALTRDPSHQNPEERTPARTGPSFFQTKILYHASHGLSLLLASIVMSFVVVMPASNVYLGFPFA